MSRILIGSSNVKRFYAKQRNQPDYRLEFATVFRAFEVAIEMVKDEDKVIVSVLENFIEKAVDRAEDGEKKKAMSDMIESYMKKFVEIAKKVPSAKFALAYPILRPAHDWMTNNEDLIRQEFEKAYNKQCLLNITKIDAVARATQIFEKDNVHLTKQAGTSFVSNLIEMAEVAFEAEIVEVGDEEDSLIGRVLGAAKESGKLMSSSTLQDLKRDSIETRNWRGNFESMLNARFMNDNIMFARLRDEVDSETNRKKEDRTLVMGIEEPKDLPRTGNERNEKMKAIALQFCKGVNPDFSGQILFAATCGRSINGKMRMEFRLETSDQAKEIRKMFAIERAAKRISPDLANLQVMTMVTLATRIRMDIMKAIARRIETIDTAAYVPNFLSRPIMHIKKKTKEGEAVTGAFVKTLTFVDTVCQHGRALHRGDLDAAQGKAKGYFRGTMRQHFLLLDDEEEGPRKTWAFGTGGTGGAAGFAKTGSGGEKIVESVSTKARGTKRSNQDEAGGSGNGKLSCQDP
jgi:hypothetical protein